ncbi:hypothetical protein CTRI78_v000316 [Colletotrichum trifolii]|uniref:Uncharacterized protein n=1 Tax=Colletotrichum trifolii TaxID=5466 RepID=A0A4R8RVW9_COLTR|nr:hypothetical protein CTRI78_v000316 [Colletotrichum trifolii]
MKESCLYLRFFGLFLVWVQLAQPIWAVTYTYVFTYGAGDYVCHGRLEVYINSENPASRPEVTLRSVYCAPAAGGSADVHDVPVAGQNGATTGAGAYILDLGPANRNGHRGFEIGINQAAQPLAGNRRIPIMFPRVNLYTDMAGEPLGLEALLSVPVGQYP